MTSSPVPPRRSRVKARVTRHQATRRKTTTANAPAGQEAVTTSALFDDVGSSVTAQVDTATILSARFHRIVRLASGQLAAEFLPQDFALPRILLDEADLYAAAIFAPTLNEELAAAIQAMDRMRRKLDRLQSVNSTTKPKGDRTDANYRS